jgi:succinyl-CoA synthetase beta subunit
MKIHEFQGKEIFRKAGVAVLKGGVAESPEAASKLFTELGKPISVVKAQIHAGGRGKGTIVGNEKQRGVQLVKSAEEAAAVAKALLGNKLKTIQTHPDGQTVSKVFVEEGCDIDRELYLGIVLDRAAAKPVLMVSTEGGVEIEKVAEETPHLIHKEHFDPALGLQGFQVRKLCKKLGLTGTTVRAADKFMRSLCKVFVDYDCSLLEINPLVVTKSGELIALDAKINFDDNGLFRHKDVLAYRDLAEEEPSEIEASEAGLSFIKLDGNIACLVNGAGLAMSTMDIIKLHGGEPANFLDVGGGASAEKVTKAFRILLAEPNVKAVLVNIFGGIQKCTTIAEAIIAASKAVGFSVPLVVRLEGTLVEEGKKMLAESGVKLITADGLTDAAKKVVAAANAQK